MYKVLIISSEFFPYSNSGTIRSEKLAKYLPENGWETVILTKKPPKNFKPETQQPFLKSKIYRINRFDIEKPYIFLKEFYIKIRSLFKKTTITTNSMANSTNIKSNLAHNLIVPDLDIFWVLPAIIFGILVIWKEKPKIILASGPPHSMYLIGCALKKLTRRRLILDFRDPWTFNPFNEPRKFKILDRLDNYLERKTIKTADKIFVVAPVFKKRFLEKYNFLKSNNVAFMPNGYDPDDFGPTKFTIKKKFIIVHNGFFYQKRSSVKFIKALLILLEDGKVNMDKIVVRFVGGVDYEGEQLVLKSPFRNVFNMLEKVSHQESIHEICNSDLLLLIPGPGEGTYTGKFFEYLGASKPIFCIANEGPTVEIIKKYQIGSVVKDENEIEIAEGLISLIRKIQNKEFIFPNIDFLQCQFNRKKIAQDMAKVFNDC